MPIEMITAMRSYLVLCIAVINSLAIILMIEDHPRLAWVVWGLAALLCAIMNGIP